MKHYHDTNHHHHHHHHHSMGDVHAKLARVESTRRVAVGGGGGGGRGLPQLGVDG
jgi:hypothetical protein